jgi:cytochrome c biogenesis factor
LVDSGSILTFIIVSFSLSVILIMKRDSLPPNMKRPLALIAIVMVSFAFFLVLYSFLHS